LKPGQWRASFRSLVPQTKVVVVIGIFDWFIAVWTTLLGLWLASLGLVLFTGGAERMSGPTYVGLLVILPWWAWGVVPLVAGLTLVFRGIEPRLTVASCLLGAAWASSWALSITYAVTVDPAAGITGAVTYAAMTLLLVSTAATHAVLQVVVSDITVGGDA